MTAPQFQDRHLGVDHSAEALMLEALGVSSLDELMDQAVPGHLRQEDIASVIPEPATEAEVLQELRALAEANTVRRSMLGRGYYGTHTPSVITRNVLQNPSWYTCLLYTSPSPRDGLLSRMPSSA